MADCSRCGIARLMNRHGAENVIQIDKKPLLENFGDGEYEIYVKMDDPKRDAIWHPQDTIFYDGWYWKKAVIVFSRKHADDDCDARGIRPILVRKETPSA